MESELRIHDERVDLDLKHGFLIWNMFFIDFNAK